jgi:hypothetical protein
MREFDILQKSSTFLFEIMTPVSSENILGFDNTCLVGGILFMYILKSKGHRIDCWGILCSLV